MYRVRYINSGCMVETCLASCPSQAVQQSKWVIETEAKLKLEVMTMDGLKRLLKQAGAMQQSRVIEVVSARMRELLSTAQDWENEAKTALKQR